MPRAEYTVRILIVFIGLTGVFAGVSWWLYHLQVERHDELHAKAKKIYTATSVAFGRRGDIRDKYGNLLAGIEECADVLLEPRRIKPQDREETIS